MASNDNSVREIVECPDCFALVYADRLKAHEYWHDEQEGRS